MRADRRALFAVALFTALAWLLLHSQAWPARLWGALLLVPLPIAAAWQVKFIDNPDALPRMPAYVSSAVTLWLLALVTVGVTWLSGWGWAALGLVPGSASATSAWAGALTVVGLAALWLARALGVRESAILRRLLPETPRERLAFAGLSLTAGICEELVFRGFLISLLVNAWGSPALAVLLSSAAFGWMHAYQEPGGAIRAALLGVVLAVPVVLYGSVIPSMIAHTAIDVTGGILLQKRLISALE